MSYEKEDPFLTVSCPWQLTFVPQRISQVLQGLKVSRVGGCLLRRTCTQLQVNAQACLSGEGCARGISKDTFWNPQALGPASMHDKPSSRGPSSHPCQPGVNLHEVVPGAKRPPIHCSQGMRAQRHLRGQRSKTFGKLQQVSRPLCC